LLRIFFGIFGIFGVFAKFVIRREIDQQLKTWKKKYLQKKRTTLFLTFLLQKSGVRFFEAIFLVAFQKYWSVFLQITNSQKSAKFLFVPKIPNFLLKNKKF